jgi:hypothetical protein
MASDGTRLYVAYAPGWSDSPLAVVDLATGEVDRGPNYHHLYSYEYGGLALTFAEDGYLYLAQKRSGRYIVTGYIYRVDPETLQPVARASFTGFYWHNIPGSMFSDGSNLWITDDYSGSAGSVPMSFSDGDITLALSNPGGWSAHYGVRAGSHVLTAYDTYPQTTFTLTQYNLDAPSDAPNLVAGSYSSSDDGVGYWAGFNKIVDMSYDGSSLWVMDYNSPAQTASLRRVDTATVGDGGTPNPGMTSTLTLDATSTVSTPIIPNSPGAYVVEANGDKVFYVDYNPSTATYDLMQYSISGGTSTVLASGVSATDMTSSSKYIWLADRSPTMKIVDRSTGEVRPFGYLSLLPSYTSGVVYAPDGYLYVYDGDHKTLVRLDPVTGYPVAWASTDFYNGGNSSVYAELTADSGYLYINVMRSSDRQRGAGHHYRVPLTWMDGASLDGTTYAIMSGGPWVSAGTNLYITGNSYATVFRYSKSDLLGVPTLTAGPPDGSPAYGFVDGPGSSALFGTSYNYNIASIASMSSNGSSLWMYDAGNHVIRRIGP